MKTILQLACVLFLFAGCSKTGMHYIDNPIGPSNLHNRAAGASANELLSSAQYTTLRIEIQYFPGYEPDAAAVNHLTGMLSGLLNKSEITVSTKEIFVADAQNISTDDALEIEKGNRTVFTRGNEMGVYILYTNGNYTDPDVLGVAYKNTSVVIFGKKIHDNSGGLGQPSRTKLEATVLEHEMGHLLGLVNLGSPMLTDHEDGEHGKHCNNSNCLMYYAAETSDILGILLTGNIPSLDANCLADLKANGGK